MEFLVPLAAKSFLFAAATLLLLKLMQRRSAADRSWIAHLGLLAIALLPLAWFLPQLEVATSWMAQPPAIETVAAPVTVTEAAPGAATFPASAAPVAAAPVDWGFWAYAVPAGLLVLLTLIAVLRLVALKARATVLVEPHWLSALAHAQRRMGFKNGTALLTSDDLRSPISWGLVRPVILLNSAATEAHGEAEAIIAHELAHVARLDWAKLLLARVTVAICWFNPLVWLLAREAHQLREEAADDAVLAANIDDTDYARLLVGIARHECRGMLLGAHGVAPARNSLSRRIRRVLDGAIARAPGGWRWSSAVAFFAAGMAVPVAALNFVPTQPQDALPDTAIASAARATAGSNAAKAAAAAAESSVAAAEAAAATAVAVSSDAVSVAGPNGATIATKADGRLVMVGASGGVIEIYPADSKGRRRAVMTSPSGGKMEYADARAVPGLAVAIATAPNGRKASAIDRAIELKATGVTPEYVAAIRAAAPQLQLTHDEIVSMKAVGVSPAFLQEMTRLGYRHEDGEEIVGAYAVGVRADYIRSLAAAGYGRLSLDDLTQLKAVGVSAADVERFRRAGYHHLDVDKLVELKALGITPEELKASEDYDE